MGEKNPRWALGLLLAVGWLGAHRFYLGRYASAVAQLALALLCAALWLWGGRAAAYAPYLLGPMVFWLIRDGFWLFDYFRVEEDMDSRLSAFAQSQLDEQASLPAAKAEVAAAPVPASVAQPAIAAALPADPLPKPATDPQTDKKSLAIQMAQKHIGDALARRDVQTAHAEAETLIKYLVQRSRKPQSDPHLAMAYLLQGMTFYQTGQLDAARKKLQMGVHLGAAFAELAQPVRQAQLFLQRLRSPQMASAAAATPVLQPGQYPLLMQSQDWARALALCEQTIALRQSGHEADVPDLAQHHLHAMEIAQHLGDKDRQRVHGQALVALAAPVGAAVPVAMRRQALERLGDLCQADEDHQAATAHYAQALELVNVRSSGGNAAAQAMALCALLQRMASSHAALGETAQALQCWQRLALYLDSFDRLDQQGQRMPDPEAVSVMLADYAAFAIRHQPTRVKPLVQQALRIQQRSCRGYSLAAARAYEVFAAFLEAHGHADARRSYLKKALLLVQICDPDNSVHLQQLKTAIREAA
ncbi:TM2 domain-containing protein [Comamonas sp. JUb58]|uniref:TM2 domain-containing protein n=1 Tax=Comamonas sp. JUb58 TaxID=2485114 RepID=UPI00105C3F0A|nr:TM2 domain-containing protein [Comamonas sp. JUb58]TDS78098.1 TM2 domain-containing protein [Comamonas sp. JUb58]